MLYHIIYDAADGAPISVGLSDLEGIYNSLGNEKKYSPDLTNYCLVNDVTLLPQGWSENNNMLYVKNVDLDKPLPRISYHPNVKIPTNSIVILDAVDGFNIMIWRKNSYLHVCSSSLKDATINIGGGFVYIGERIRSAGGLIINCRNRGSVVIKTDVLFSNNVKLITDDCHTIYDINSRKRINPYGGSIVLEKHIWVGYGVTVMGNSLIRSNSIIGESSFVRNFVVESNTLCAGIPVKQLKRDINWDQDDWLEFPYP